MVDSHHLERTADHCTRFLAGVVDLDWTVPVPDLEMTVAEVVAHTATGLLWYAIDLTAGGDDLQLVEHQVRVGGDPADLLTTLRVYGTIVRTVIDAAPTSARGFHPMGAADPSGFAAMACDELLVHTDDAARGLGASFGAGPDLAEPVLRRLFPWVVVDDDPWQLLLWANGRRALGDWPRLDGWRWHCRPLDEWDGAPPA